MKIYLATHYKDFGTMAEAEAFVQGIQFVNDDAISVSGMEDLPYGGQRVFVFDKDAEPVEEPEAIP